MPFEQLKDLAGQLAKLQDDLLPHVPGEPYQGFSEQVRLFQDALAQAQEDFAATEALEREVAEAAAAAKAAPAAPAKAAVETSQRPVPRLPDLPEPPLEEDGSVWKAPWTADPSASEAPSDDSTEPAKRATPPPPKTGKEIWEDLSGAG